MGFTGLFPSWSSSKSGPAETDQGQRNAQTQREDTDFKLQNHGGRHDAVARGNQQKTKKEGDEMKREAELDRMKGDMSRVEQKMHGLEKDLDVSKSHNRKKEEEIRRLTRDLDEERHHHDHKITLLASRTSELESAQAVLTKANSLNRKKEEEIYRLTRDLDEERRHHNHKAALLASRTSELEGAQAFLTTADSLSGAEVISMVETLNSEIHQISCVVADSFDFEESVIVEEEEGFKEMEKASEHIVGKKMVEMLRSTHGEDLGLVVQIALQACMVGCCAYIVAHWHFDDSAYGQFLSQLYDKMIQREEQAVSGRWRALTKAQVQPLPHMPAEPLMTRITDSMIKLLVLSRRGRWPQVRDLLLTKFGNRMATIGKLAFRLNKAVGEDVTSSNLEALCVLPGSPFDPATMDDTYAEGSRERNINGRGVLCTSGLGLWQRVKVPREHRWNETILLKPKIVLDSLLEDMRE